MTMPSAKFGQSRKAKHCSELLGTDPSIDELVPALSLLGERLARILPGHLSPFAGGEPPLVRIGMPMDCNLASIAADIETLASHQLMAVGPKGLQIGRAACRERVFQSVLISVVAGSLTKKKKTNQEMQLH